MTDGVTTPESAAKLRLGTIIGHKYTLVGACDGGARAAWLVRPVDSSVLLTLHLLQPPAHLRNIEAKFESAYLRAAMRPQ